MDIAASSSYQRRFWRSIIALSSEATPPCVIWWRSTVIATTSSTGAVGINRIGMVLMTKADPLEEPCAGKRCAMSRTEEIATPGGRRSRQMTPRRTTDLTLKGEGDSSMLLKRGVAEDVYGAALQRLRDKAKAALPEP